MFGQADNDIPLPYGAQPEMPWYATGFYWLSTTVYVVFLIWMLVGCVRKDPYRLLWLWVMLFFQPFGAIVYFFARWLPNNDVRMPASLRRFARGSEINRLQAAALQIGNAHQFVQLGDVLREIGRFDRARDAYQSALEKEPDNPQALWGAALIDLKKNQFETANGRLEKLLQIDPQYKFGDVSLAYGKTLYRLQNVDEARERLEQHIKRWRHPEALYLLACIHSEQGDAPGARSHLEAMLLDIAGSPKAIARHQGFWKSKARRLLRKLPRSLESG